MAKAWNLGNTTVRNPYRLKDGLRVLLNSQLHGNLIGHTNELEFAKLLNDAGTVSITAERLRQTDPSKDPSDVGRKWRAALMQLGFITPKLSNNVDIQGRDAELVAIAANTPGLSGRPYEITPNGQRLLAVDTVVGEQEVFLRALFAHRIPSRIESFAPVPSFSPLRLVLQTLASLEQAGLEAYISFEEMTSIVQMSDDSSLVANVVDRIRAYRHERQQATDKARYDRSYRTQASSVLTGQSPETLTDYADLNFRYLKITGLFSSRGRGISIAPDKQVMVDQLLSSSLPADDEAPYLLRLWNGAELPTDHAPAAVEAILSLAQLLNSSGEHIELPPLATKRVQDLTLIRYDLEERWRKLLESQFASQQKANWSDITQFLHALATNLKGIVPRGEAPAYLEWSIWRAFLAINSLVNQPWEARRFPIDQDFLPTATAPGRGPDMLFEFHDYALVVEVTLTASSRQEAAEGEPVRRHVAEIVERMEGGGKPVYGLFIANAIDSNTAETLRIGTWYKSDDSRMSLRIVPLTLSQFTSLFEASFAKQGHLSHSTIERILLECLADRNADAPQWKLRINQSVMDAVQKIQHEPHE